MAQRSKVLSLPDPVKNELDKRLVRGGFCDYTALSEWLCEQGYEISKSAIHRYGQAFDERLSAIRVATEQARAVTEAAGDDRGDLGDALTMLVQEKTFQALVEMQSLNPEKIDLTKLGRMVAELNRASVQQKKWIAEAREKTKATAEEVVKVAKKEGLTEEKAQQIRRMILGIV